MHFKPEPDLEYRDHEYENKGYSTPTKLHRDLGGAVEPHHGKNKSGQCGEIDDDQQRGLPTISAPKSNEHFLREVGFAGD